MRAIVAGLLVVLCGCAGMREAGMSEPEQYDQEQRARHEADNADGLPRLLARARFDTQCEQAGVVVLERAPGSEDGPATLVGGQGCGRQVQYRRRLRRSAWSNSLVTRNTTWERVRDDGQLQTVVVAHDP